MFDASLRRTLDAPLRRAALALDRPWITPDRLTVAGLVLGLGSAAAAALQLWALALALWLVSRACDGLDGSLARLRRGRAAGSDGSGGPFGSGAADGSGQRDADKAPGAVEANDADADKANRAAEAEAEADADADADAADAADADAADADAADKATEAVEANGADETPGAVTADRAAPSEAGGFLDIVADFTVYGFTVFGVGIGATAGFDAPWWPFVLVLVAYYVNGAAFLAFSSIAERTGRQIDDGRSLSFLGRIAEGAETIVVHSLWLIVPFLAWQIAVVWALFVGASAVQRIWAGYRALR